MGNPLSVILANIFMAKLERDVVDRATPRKNNKINETNYLPSQHSFYHKQEPHKVFIHKVRIN